jgi:AcrR family transcriptional regulator
MPRTRSESAHQEVIRAALELIAERGMDATSMDAIAARSGVSKATIYKHWADKDALLLEVIASIHGLHSRPKFDSGDTRADIVAVLSYQPKENAGVRERILPHVIAYSANRVEFGLAWRNMAMEPPRRELTQIIQQGIARGELIPGLDIDLCLLLLLGPVLYWHIFLRRAGVNAAAVIEGVVEVFWRAFAAPPANLTPRLKNASRGTGLTSRAGRGRSST